MYYLNIYVRKFPGDPVVRTLVLSLLGPGSIPGQGAKIPQAMRRSQKTNKQTNKN